mmetsp:Transcript_57855/g.161483  ORF Transcript_57855/g.161483 Transcript_57855/m.161483 type:complete len:225 (+) Transcript_57855:66-740(+)
MRKRRSLPALQLAIGALAAGFTARVLSPADSTGMPSWLASVSSAAPNAHRRRAALARGVCSSLLVQVASEPRANAERTFIKMRPFGSRGLRVSDVRVGTGAEVVNGSVVYIQWSGRLAAKQGWLYGRCADIDCELRFRVGDGTTIQGLDEGIRGMREGGLRRLEIPPALSYQEGQELEPLQTTGDTEAWKRRLYGTIFNKVRIANGEGDTLSTVIIDVSLRRVV